MQGASTQPSRPARRTRPYPVVHEEEDEGLERDHVSEGRARADLDEPVEEAQRDDAGKGQVLDPLRLGVQDVLRPVIIRDDDLRQLAVNNDRPQAGKERTTAYRRKRVEEFQQQRHHCQRAAITTNQRGTKKASETRARVVRSRKRMELSVPFSLRSSRVTGCQKARSRCMTTAACITALK